MKKWLALLLAALLCLGLAACAAPESAKTEEPLVFAVASDLHYIAPSLTDRGALFTAVAENGDGKLILYSEEILEAFTEEMLRLRPDALILSGDLSFNGEYESLAALTEKLARIEAGGTRVLVIPGNHDVNNYRSAGYSGESFYFVDDCSPAEFRELFADFGYDEALSLDEGSGSYVAELRADLRVLMLDTNSVRINAFPEESLAWLEDQLGDAQSSGARVLAVCHQNLLMHNEQFIAGYRVSNAAAICELLERYGILASLSGHMHIQHLSRGAFPELLSSSLALPPNRYGVLCWDGESLRYEAASVDVERWARESGQTDESLLRFSETARDFFWQIAYRQAADRYADGSLPSGDVERLAALFADTNLAYFTGERVDRAALAEGIEYWKTLDEGFHFSYLESILNDPGEDPLSVTLWEKPVDEAPEA